MSARGTIGRYRVLKKLAAGGMAEIFLARQEGPAGFSKTVVVKRMLPHMSDRGDFVEMFLDEARLVALLSHPNVVQVFDFGEDDGAYYLAMEYLAGEDLGSMRHLAARAKEPLPPEISARVIAGACEGLHYAHTLADDAGRSLNIVHRDVSPSNIIVTYQGIVKILDFGIAKMEGKAQQTKAGVVKGKYRYMSPEQVAGREIDPRSDVFSLGIVLHELLTGERLFDGRSEPAIMRAVMREPIRSPRSVSKRIPRELDEIVMRALERDRDKRYQSALQLRRALEAHLAALPEPITTERLREYLMRLAGPARIEERMSLGRGEVSASSAGTGSKPHAPASAGPAADTRPDRTVGELPDPTGVSRPLALEPEPGGRAHRPPRPPRSAPSGPFGGGSENEEESLALDLDRSNPFERVTGSARPPRQLHDQPPPALCSGATGPRPKAFHAGPAYGAGGRRTWLVIGGAGGVLLALLAVLWTVVSVGGGEVDMGESSVASVLVTTEPPGARLWVDGRPTGLETPARVRVLPSGGNELSLRHPDYLEERLTVPPREGAEEQPIHAVLERGSRLEVSTEPEGARARIAGHGELIAPGVFDHGLPAGIHEIRMTLHGHVPKVVEVEAVEPGPLLVHAVLEPGVEVSVATSPSGARVLVDGEETGLSSPALLVLPSGRSHALAVRKAGFARRRQRVPALEPGERAEIHLELEHLERRRVQRELEAEEEELRRLEAKLEEIRDREGGFVLETTAREALERRREAQAVERRIDATDNRIQLLLERLTLIDDEIAL